MVVISLRSVGNFIVKCGVDTMAPSLFNEDLPNKALYEVQASTTIYPMFIVFVALPLPNVVSKSIYPLYPSSLMRTQLFVLEMISYPLLSNATCRKFPKTKYPLNFLDLQESSLRHTVLSPPLLPSGHLAQDQFLENRHQ